MAAQIIKEFRGFSGAQVLLMKKHNRLFVRKIGNVERNVERMAALQNQLPLPIIYNYSKNKLDLEYIHSLDIKTYLKTNHYEKLLQFLFDCLEMFAENTVEKDYTDVYIQKLKEVDFTDIPFTAQDLLSQLPKTLPSSNYYGDLTLENILYNDTRGFILIDCQTSEYDSYIFDIAKLRQDLECGWFTRYDNAMIDVKIRHVQTEILKKYPVADNDYLLILMLLRAYKYAKPNTYERQFLKDWMKILWK